MDVFFFNAQFRFQAPSSDGDQSQYSALLFSPLGVYVSKRVGVQMYEKAITEKCKSYKDISVKIVKKKKKKDNNNVCRQKQIGAGETRVAITHGNPLCVISHSSLIFREQ